MEKIESALASQGQERGGCGSNEPTLAPTPSPAVGEAAADTWPKCWDSTGHLKGTDYYVRQQSPSDRLMRVSFSDGKESEFPWSLQWLDANVVAGSWSRCPDHRPRQTVGKPTLADIDSVLNSRKLCEELRQLKAEAEAYECKPPESEAKLASLPSLAGTEHLATEPPDAWIADKTWAAEASDKSDEQQYWKPQPLDERLAFAGLAAPSPETFRAAQSATAMDEVHRDASEPLATDDEKTCGELSCEECNERYAKARAEIERLAKELKAVAALATVLAKQLPPVEAIAKEFEYTPIDIATDLAGCIRGGIARLQRSIAEGNDECERLKVQLESGVWKQDQLQQQLAAAHAATVSARKETWDVRQELAASQGQVAAMREALQHMLNCWDGAGGDHALSGITVARKLLTNIPAPPVVPRDKVDRLLRAVEKAVPWIEKELSNPGRADKELQVAYGDLASGESVETTPVVPLEKYRECHEITPLPRNRK